MKKLLAIVIAIVLTASLLTGCKKNDSVVKEPEPTQAAGLTEKPAEPEDVLGQANGTAPSEATSVEEPVSSEETIPEDPSKDLTWNSYVKAYDDFLNGLDTADGLAQVSDYFKPLESYYIGEIAEGLRLDAEREVMLPRVLSDISYALIDCAADDIPELAVQFTFEEESGHDSEYTEILVFYCSEGWVYCGGSLSSYYREMSELNPYGFARMYGSAGARIGVENSYYFDEYGRKAFLYGITEIFNLDKPEILNEFLPSDSILFRDEEATDVGSNCNLSIVTFNEYTEDYIFAHESAEGDSYDEFIRNECVFCFYDDDYNTLMPDEAYLNKCEEDGIHVVSYEEMNEMILNNDALFGLTPEMKSATPISKWTHAPAGACDLTKGLFPQFRAIADSAEVWQEDAAEDFDVSYAVCDLDGNGRLDLIRSIKNYWTEEQYLAFFEVNRDFSGVTELAYREQFMYDDEDSPEGESLDGGQPDVRSSSIRMYTSDGKNVYVFPTTFCYDTFAASSVVTRNMVLSKSFDGESIDLEGDMGSVECYTEYSDNGDITLEHTMYYLPDGSETSNEGFLRSDEEYFGAPVDGYYSIEFCFVAPDRFDNLIDAVILSYNEWQGHYMVNME